MGKSVQDRAELRSEGAGMTGSTERRIWVCEHGEPEGNRILCNKETDCDYEVRENIRGLWVRVCGREEKVRGVPGGAGEGGGAMKYVVRYKEITVKEITLEYGRDGIEDVAKDNVERGHFNPEGAVVLNKYPFREVISVNGRVKP